MDLRRVLLTAPKSGSGKTVITCGLLAALQARGIRPTAFKCGPDYIDPMFHRRVLGVESRNLDSFFLDEELLRELFVRHASGGDFALIEGVMGYYDGLGGTSLKASAWEVGRMTDTPAILVMDAKGASLSLAALVSGFLNYLPDSGIRGVILNRMNPMMLERIRPAVEALGVQVLGCVPEEDVFALRSRHLGLAFPDGDGEEALREQIRAMGRRMEETVDVDGILRLAEQAKEFCGDVHVSSGRTAALGTPGAEPRGAAAASMSGPPAAQEAPVAELSAASEAPVTKLQAAPESAVAEPPLQIGVAMDEAFCFYYEENLRLLELLGARLRYFSPLRDRELPADLDGLLLGGGYPELWAKELSENASMRASIRRAVEFGMPSLAECGGFLYLHRNLEGEDGNRYPMAGVLPFDAFRQRRLTRFGYVELQTEDGCLLRGHEFHYWESEQPGDRWTARKPESKRSWNCVHERHGGYWGFPHIYYPSNEEWLRRWMDRCREYRKKRTE